MLTSWLSNPPASNRSSVDEARGAAAAEDDDTLVVEPDQGNVLGHIISQLRPGADLSRVVLPTFILEPRSMLERITKWVFPGRNSPSEASFADPLRPP
ncbi:oxysterol-binding protein-like protein OBPalpha [Colletotrichum spaethianum]|uniref:Oxysterol-binding protein-like protein OBPalpha n=1 Tax=Colletotrichum spaethianum TaxID=700344 RepID=A0AA37NUL0_9PEZI|nr:oxysterol-binding protein-like protein OBPalpha [Colletotrichum spaethianum]GKT42157.1 oxysterol-binding protein-like protein OBPalpha [Colletotrichum spaethianum]